MFDMFGGGVDSLPLQVIPWFNAELGYWIVQFQLDHNPFWQVDFKEQTDPEANHDLRWAMRKEATKMLASEVQRRLTA